MVVQDEPAWLALPSQLNIQDEYNKIGDQKLCTLS